MKRRILFSVFLIIVTTMCCCNKNNSLPVYPQFIIHYIDSSGNDLFTSGQNGYFRDSVKIYNINNGTDSLIYLQASMYPYGYYFTSDILGAKTPTDSGTMIIGTYNLPSSNNYTNNIIHLKAGTDDTLKGHLNGVDYDSVWYNGILKKDTMTIRK